MEKKKSSFNNYI